MDGLVQCPFDKSHRIVKSRLQYHINRDHKKETSTHNGTCPFNVKHVIPLCQMKEHVAECSQRKTFENLISHETLGTSSHASDSGVQRIETTESWDDEPDVATYNARKTLESKPVLIHIQGVPPSEKKKFREKERLRHMDISKQ